jgi:hypothetical protein
MAEAAARRLVAGMLPPAYHRNHRSPDNEGLYKAINQAVILHGHVGWSTERPLMQMLLDVSGLQIGDSTPHRSRS